MSGLGSLFPLLRPDTKKTSERGPERKFTPSTKSRVLGYLSEGLNIPRACAMTGVDYNNSMCRWIKQGKEQVLNFEEGYGDTLGDHGQFLLNMQAAMAGYNYRMLKAVQHLFFTDPRYGPMFQKALEAEHPEYYGKKAVQEVKTEAKVTYVFNELDGDGWTKRLAASGGLVKTEAQDIESTEDVMEAEFSADPED